MHFILAVHAIQPTYFFLLHRFIALCREITFDIGPNEPFGRSISLNSAPPRVQTEADTCAAQAIIIEVAPPRLQPRQRHAHCAGYPISHAPPSPAPRDAERDERQCASAGGGTASRRGRASSSPCGRRARRRCGRARGGRRRGRRRGRHRRSRGRTRRGRRRHRCARRRHGRACGRGAATRSGRARGGRRRGRRCGRHRRTRRRSRRGRRRHRRARRRHSRARGRGARRRRGCSRRSATRGRTALLRVGAVLLFVALHEAHGVILHGEGAANARRGVEHHVHPLDLPHARQFGQVHARRAAEGGTERAQVAESHAASLSETVDDLNLECVDHGLHVGRSQGALLLDALDDVHVVVGHGGDELGIVEEFAGFEVLAANDVVG